MGRRTIGRAAIVVTLLAAAVGPLRAQTLPDPFQGEAGAARLVKAGVLGLAGGWLAGGAAGIGLAKWNPLDRDELDDGAWTPGMLIGLQAGQAVGIPLAVHLANGRRGSLKTSLLVSSALSLAAVSLMWTDDIDGLFEAPGNAAAWVALPLVQIGASVLIERRTGDPKDE